MLRLLGLYSGAIESRFNLFDLVFEQVKLVDDLVLLVSKGLLYLCITLEGIVQMLGDGHCAVGVASNR